MSGADISVLPRDYAGVGTQIPSSGELKMVDVQGTRIADDGVRIRWQGHRDCGRVNSFWATYITPSYLQDAY